MATTNLRVLVLYYCIILYINSSKTS